MSFLSLHFKKCTNIPFCCLGNLYSTQASSGHLKCPTPPPTKNQSLSRKHSMELGLLSPAALSPMQSEYLSSHNHKAVTD